MLKRTEVKLTYALCNQKIILMKTYESTINLRHHVFMSRNSSLYIHNKIMSLYVDGTWIKDFNHNIKRIVTILKKYFFYENYS